MKMHARHILPILFLAFTGALHADQLIKDVQTELKDQGFFYSEITGINGSDTVAAIKRFQIRNSLEVTGTLTSQTLEALGLKNGAPILTPPEPKTTPPPRIVPPPPKPGQSRTESPVNLRKDESVVDSDRYFLKRQEATTGSPAPEPSGSRYDRPPVRTGGAPYANIYQRTPYAAAPLEVQQDVLRKAQRALAGGGFYRAAIDGLPGPATEEAILGYQRLVRLPMTGRLDLQTLSAMRLLPGRGSGPAMQPFTGNNVPSSRPQKKVYRGIWID